MIGTFLRLGRYPQKSLAITGAVVAMAVAVLAASSLIAAAGRMPNAIAAAIGRIATDRDRAQPAAPWTANASLG